MCFPARSGLLFTVETVEREQKQRAKIGAREQRTMNGNFLIIAKVYET